MLPVIFALLALVTPSQPASAATINGVPDILPIVWPLSSTSSALNVTFALMDCSSTPSGCSTIALTSGVPPTFTLAMRSAGSLPIVGSPHAMIACGNSWCANETIQFDDATTGPYIAYAGMVMWSTGVAPANTWNGQSFVVPAKEVRLTSSIADSNLPESRAHANATWESQPHANASWCARSGQVGLGVFDCGSFANATFEGQAHANATWCPLSCVANASAFVSNAWFNGTFRPTAIFGNVTMTSLAVGTATATDLTVLGAMQAQTAFDPYVMPLVFGGLTVFSTVIGLWIARQRGILGKLAITVLLVVAATWAASASVSNDTSAFRGVAVLVTSGWAIIVIFSMKDRR